VNSRLFGSTLLQRRQVPDDLANPRLPQGLVTAVDGLLDRIQGTVVLEVIVTSDGCPSQIRVARSLDRGGLDEEAVSAVAQWRFEPGRLAGAAVDVLVTIVVDFSIR
jgi:TonB family protein